MYQKSTQFLMFKRLKYFIVLGITLFTLGCSSTKKSIPRNLEMIYNPVSSSIHPEYRVYNTTDTSSIIVGKIYTKELLFNQANEENKLMARVKISYNLYNLNEKERLVDSSSFTVRYEKEPEVKAHYIEINFKSELRNDYILEIISTDINRKSTQYSFIRVDRTKEINDQDFLFVNKSNDQYLLQNTYHTGLEFEVKHYKNNLDSLNVFYFKANQEIPKSTKDKDTINYNFTAFDSVWVCYLDSMVYSEFDNEGIYYLTKEKSPQNGFVLYNFGYKYPVVQSPKKLIKPLVYLGINDTISEKDSTGRFTKLVVDNFWLEHANNIDKSRDLLKIFYNRVMFANLYFTSFVEGWQTDRGMIYIIYGIPDYVFKSDEEEKWIYNPIDMGPGISFTFKYYRNPFSLNHYILDRDKVKDSGWDEAIKMWKSGEVYYYQN